MTYPCVLPLRVRTMNFVVRLFVRVLSPLVRLAPGRDRMTAALGAAFAAAMGMVDRVHRGAAHGRALALPHIAAGLADDFVHVVGIGNRADRRHAGRAGPCALPPN